MTPSLSPNAQAILLLTAPLIAGRGTSSPDLLSPSEYKRLVRHLREMQRQPADLFSPSKAEIIRACHPLIDESRIQRLLERGFLLSQAIERWQSRAIWVVSRADAHYPRRLKARLREDAPAVIYGCGDIDLLGAGGLAVVGSRHVDVSLVNYTMAVGRLVAQAGRMIVSGGAKGIDQAAMQGALEAGGSACGVLADSLEKNAMNREHRNVLLNGQLVLMSPYDPSAGFNVGNAMQRNKLIYALADASLVVNSDFNKGGTWAGATEQLEKLNFVPVFVRTTGEPSSGLDGLMKKGALSWPNPRDVVSFEAVFDSALSTPTASPQIGLSLLLKDGQTETLANSNASMSLCPSPESQVDGDASGPVDIVLDAHLPVTVSEAPAPFTSEGLATAAGHRESLPQVLTPAETLFAEVRIAIGRLLVEPKNAAEVAAALNVSIEQAKAWLQRLVDEAVVENRKSARYANKSERLIE